MQSRGVDICLSSYFSAVSVELFTGLGTGGTWEGGGGITRGGGGNTLTVQSHKKLFFVADQSLTRDWTLTMHTQMPLLYIQIRVKVRRNMTVCSSVVSVMDMN